MRVTNSMLIQNMIRNINGNLSRLDKLQWQESSGQKIRVASDDPVLASRSLKIKSYLSEAEQLKKNADDAASWIDFSETALKSINENIQRIKELNVEGANGTNSTDEKSAIKSEISQIKEALVELGNSNFAGRYVFGGYNTDEPPFSLETTDAGEKIMYNGKYLSLGGVSPSSVSDEDLINFYEDNMDKISGQAEITSANYTDFTIASGTTENFDLTLDGVSQTITLQAGTYSLDDITDELNNQLSDKIKVSNDGKKLKITVQDGTSIKITNGTFDVTKLGFKNNLESIKDSEEGIYYKVGASNRIAINAEGSSVFGKTQNLFDSITKLELALDGETSYKIATYDNGNVVVTSEELDIQSALDDLDTDLQRLSTARSELGAKSNFIDLTKNRLDDNVTTFTELLSKNDTIDYAEVSIELSSAKAVYSASLSAGAKVIQPSLLDFLN